MIVTPLVYADAVWDRDAQDSDELAFKVGDVIEILDMTDDVWWQGSVQSAIGWFPASFVRVRIIFENSSQNNFVPLQWYIKILYKKGGGGKAFVQVLEWCANAEDASQLLCLLRAFSGVQNLSKQ